MAGIAGEFGLDTTAEPSRVADGSAGASWPVSDTWVTEFLASRTGRAWSEDRLSPRERAFVALTARVSQRALGESL